MKIAHANEEAYLNELIAYRLQFDGYTYDQLTRNLIKVSIIISQKFSPMQASIVVTSFRSEHVVTTIKEPKPIRRGTKLAIIFCTLSLPIKYVEVPIVTISTQVEGLEKPIIPKPIPLMILEIGVGAEVTLIDTIMLLRFSGLQIQY